MTNKEESITQYAQEFARRLIDAHKWSAKDAAAHVFGMNIKAIFDQGIDQEDAADEEASLVAYENFHA
jgi:hypothetical protein